MVFGVSKNPKTKRARSNKLPHSNQSDPEVDEIILGEEVLTFNGEELALWKFESNIEHIIGVGWKGLERYLGAPSSVENHSPRVVLAGSMNVTLEEAINYSNLAGLRVSESISKFTNYFVVGSNSISAAEVAQVFSLRKKGVNIRIMTEMNYVGMLAHLLHNLQDRT